VRGLFVIIHRWGGLFIALFLLVAGLTGSVISWDHELDEWLNPDLFEARDAGTPLPPLELVSRFEASDPRVRVTSFPLSFENGKTAELFVEPRINPATAKLYEVDYNQVYLEPATGEIAGKRYWGKISLDRRDILPFLYKLHYSMHVPDFFNSDRWGIWLMGIVGLVWTFDCFVGLWLTFPSVPRNQPGNRSWIQRWAPAWRIKSGASFYRTNFDIHRAFGLWVWLLLLILAFTSISMNLGTEIVRPMLSKISTLTPEIWDLRTPASIDKPIVPTLSFENILDRAAKEAAKRSWQEPLGSAFYSQEFGVYGVSFFQPGFEHGEGGMGTKALYFDGNTGAGLGEKMPWSGTAADLFMQLQFPLHSGRIAGVPGRVVLSLMGVIIAVLSLTGIVIWFKKRVARIKSRERHQSPRGLPLFAPAFAFAHSLSCATVCALDRLTNEGRLRDRFGRISRSGPNVGTSANTPLWAMAAYSLRAMMLIILVGLIASRRLVGGFGKFVFAVWLWFRSLADVVLSPQFWSAGKADAKIYAHKLFGIWDRSTEFAASLVRKAVAGLSSGVPEGRAVQRIARRSSDEIE
jgi:uncharacterized iron-regulated membrane protein